MKIDGTFRLVCAGIVASVFCVVLMAPGTASARGRGPSKAQIQAMQKKVQEQQQMNAGLSKVQAQKDQETMSKYDLNGNGKIDSSEKPAWDKYWREVKLGKQPHPYSTITQADVTKAANPQTSKTAAKKK